MFSLLDLRFRVLHVLASDLYPTRVDQPCCQLHCERVQGDSSATVYKYRVILNYTPRLRDVGDLE